MATIPPNAIGLSAEAAEQFLKPMPWYKDLGLRVLKGNHLDPRFLTTLALEKTFTKIPSVKPQKTMEQLMKLGAPEVKPTFSEPDLLGHQTMLTAGSERGANTYKTVTQDLPWHARELTGLGWTGQALGTALGGYGVYKYNETKDSPTEKTKTVYQTEDEKKVNEQINKELFGGTGKYNRKLYEHYTDKTLNPDLIEAQIALAKAPNSNYAELVKGKKGSQLVNDLHAWLKINKPESPLLKQIESGKPIPLKGTVSGKNAAVLSRMKNSTGNDQWYMTHHELSDSEEK